jgi:Uncharacterized alpha/beta hydrolase domain (DUF2235)
MSLKAIQSANRDIGNEAPSPFQDCRDVVHLSFFFDGTGNNRYADEEEKKWSNVARLFFAARDDKKNGVYRVYLSGVGTRFNHSKNWAERVNSWIQDSTFGNAFGEGGDLRLTAGDRQMSDALEKILMTNAQREGGKVKQLADKNQGEGFAKLNEALSNHRLIKHINFSIFGFSRGAALARAFSNRVAEKLQPAQAGYAFEGYPARINFLGVFDTVASFGMPGKNWGGWKTKDLTIPPHAESCHHYVAAHELRFSFPLDLVRDKGQYHGNMVEKVYPGVHSDVGGGYEPKKQGRTDELARVPLLDMQKAAIDHGTRLHSLKDLPSLMRSRLHIDTQTLLDYRTYMTAAGGQTGTVEAQIKRHMVQYFAYRGTQYRKQAGTSTQNEIRLEGLRKDLAHAKAQEDKASDAAWQTYNPFSKTFGRSQTIKADKVETYWEKEIARLETEIEAAERDAKRLSESDEGIAVQARALERAVKTGNRFYASNGTLIYVLEKKPWMLEAWKTKISDNICQFFDRYVHDSRTDFIGGNEPFVYFRNRGIHEQARKASGAGGTW